MGRVAGMDIGTTLLLCLGAVVAGAVMTLAARYVTRDVGEDESVRPAEPTESPARPGWLVSIDPSGRKWRWSVIDESELVAASGVVRTERQAEDAARAWVKEQWDNRKTR